MSKALIAVRGGSQRVPKKNSRPFAGSNLLAIKIEQLQQVPELDGIMVNSEDDELLGIARWYGCETVKRPANLAANDTPVNEMFRYCAEQCDADTICWITVTSPLVSAETIKQALLSYQLAIGAGYDSVASVHRIHKFLLDAQGQPINYDPQNMPHSQGLPPLFSFGFEVAVLPRELMIRRKTPLGAKPFLFVLPPDQVLDIDTMEDFEMAEILYERRKP